MSARSVMIYNERTKLIANAYDRASTAMGAGSLLPLINLSKPNNAAITVPAMLQFALSACFFIFFAGVLDHPKFGGATLFSSQPAPLIKDRNSSIARSY
jgi:hypothetical protein